MSGCKLANRFLALLLATGFLVACKQYPNLEYQAPRDELLEACNDPDTDPMALIHTLPAPSGTGASGGRTPFSCEGLWKPGSMDTMLPVAPSVAGVFGATAKADGRPYRIASSKADPFVADPKPGLVVLIEPGTAEANKRLWQDYKASVFGPLIESATFPSQLKPHFRTIISNFTFAFLKKTFQDGPKQNYGHVYFVKGDANLKEVFYRTVQKALSLHTQVDLFLVGHGFAGMYLMTRDLDPADAGNITAYELQQWLIGLNAQHPQITHRVRSMFQTHGWTAAISNMPPPDNMSMHMVFRNLALFPTTNYYVNFNINVYPLHRDFVMFESYYKDLNYANALFTASKIMKYSSDGSIRTQIPFPAVQAMGCIYLFDSNPDPSPTNTTAGRYCKPQFQEPLAYPTDIINYNSSRPRYRGGVTPSP